MVDQNQDKSDERRAQQDKLLHRGNDLSGSALAGAGLQFSAAIVASAMGGLWLDQRFNTGPWLLMLSVFVGASAGFWGMYRTLNRQLNREDQKGT